MTRNGCCGLVINSYIFTKPNKLIIKGVKSHEKNHLHRQIHLCLIILLLLICSSSQVFAAPKVKLKNTKIKLSSTKLTYNKKVQRPKIRVTYYAVCPMGSTGNIEEIKMIDFSDLSNMRKFG